MHRKSPVISRLRFWCIILALWPNNVAAARARAGDVLIEGRKRHANIRVCQHGLRRLDVVIGQFGRTPTNSSEFLRRQQSRARALPDQAALKFHQRAEHVRIRSASIQALTILPTWPWPVRAIQRAQCRDFTRDVLGWGARKTKTRGHDPSEHIMLGRTVPKLLRGLPR